MTLLSLFAVNLLSENLLLLLSILIFTAILVSKVGARYGVPSLLLFLLIGMLVGADGIGLKFENYEIAETIGHFAMTIILFTAGLETSLPETKPVLRQAVSLSTVGVLLTILLTGTFIMAVFGGHFHYPWLGPILLAAIMSSTDSASVFSVLRSKRLRLRESLGPMLELESGNSDPIAYTLTMVMVSILSNAQMLGQSAGKTILVVLGLLVLQIAVGALVGIGVGYGAKWVLDHVKLPGGALYSILILSTGFFAHGVAGLLQGNGLMALYVAAIIIGNKARIQDRRSVNSFFEGMTWLMQLIMFLLLGLLARPSRMLAVIVPALLIGAFLFLIARPVATFLTLLPFKRPSYRARTFTSWVGLKGSGPILFSLAPVVAGLEGSADIFNIVFIITLFSLLLQGNTLSFVAKKLHMCYDEEPVVESFGIEMPENIGMLRDHTVTEEELQNGNTVRDLHLPHGIRIVTVRRGERFLVPHGSMPLEAGDHLVLILGESDD